MNDETSNEISIARALTELKMLGKRIDRTIVDGLFVSAFRGEETTTLHSMSREDADKLIKGSLQSTTDLIKYRNNLKMKIVESNAMTTVDISGTTYTVAGAIERKNSIAFEKKLIKKLRENLANVVQSIERENLAVDRNLQELLGEKMKGESSDGTTIKFVEDYRKLNNVHLLDPIGIRKKIEDLETSVEDFEKEVDIALSENNAITKIAL